MSCVLMSSSVSCIVVVIVVSLIDYGEDAARTQDKIHAFYIRKERRRIICIYVYYMYYIHMTYIYIYILRDINFLYLYR